MPSVSCGRLPRRRGRLAGGVRARGRRGGARGDARHAVPDRLDHEDVHRGRRAAAAGRGAALARRSAHTVPPRKRSRPDDRPDAYARLRPSARAAGGDLGDDAGARARGAARRHCGRRAGARARAWWHYSNLAFALLGEVVARAHGGTWEEALAGAYPRPARALPDDARSCRARRLRLLRRALLGGGPAPTAISTSAARARSASFGRRPATSLRWGAFLAAGDDRVLERRDARGDGARPGDGRPRALDGRVGHRPRRSPARASTYSSATAAPCPDIWRASSSIGRPGSAPPC